jgi:uncharacterized protein (DUF952 family)
MGFHVEVNCILRSDEDYVLAVGKVCDFRKSGSRIFFDNIPVWLTKSDWTALAEISIVEQTRDPDPKKKELTGKFRIEHVYAGDEQNTVTDMFRRMFSFPGEFDPYFYLLEDRATYEAAVKTGYLVRDDLRTEGFIHSSPANQLTRVANKHYADVDDLVCALVAKDRVLAQVKYEPATAGIYPHIYGPLNMDAVDKVVDIKPGPDGKYDIDISKLI